MARACLHILPLIIVLATLVAGQTSSTSDPQALTIVAQSAAALSGGVSISDVTLIGNATSTIDGQSGSVMLLAKDAGQSRVEISADGNTRVELQALSDGAPSCWWSGDDGRTHESPVHNCLTDAAWYFPSLSRLAKGATDSQFFKDLGEMTEGGLTLHHIQSWQTTTRATKSVVAEWPRLSTVDYYLDPKSMLPFIVRFNVHPDDDSGRDIPVEVRLADYRQVYGVQVPFRILKLINGAAVLDVTVSDVKLNTGLADALFTAN